MKSYIQWNDLDEKVSANVLVGWEYRSGSEIYFVYDEISDRVDRPNLASRNRMLLAKWTYKFRFWRSAEAARLDALSERVAKQLQTRQREQAAQH